MHDYSFVSMKRAVSCCSVLAVLAAAEATAQDVTNGTWSIEGTGYTVEVGLPAANVKGASLILRSGTTSASSTGRVGTTVPTFGVRLRRVIVSGEIQTHDAPEGAALWLRVERGPAATIVDYGFDGRLQGGEGWTPKTLSLPVPADATRISYGIRLWGRGAVLARSLRLDTGAALDPGVPLP